MRTLYFDCFSGASGNMILGGLIGLGVDAAALDIQLKKLRLPEISLNISTVDRSGIAANHVEVAAPDQKGHRNLSSIVQIIENSELSGPVKSRAIAIFTRLAEAEASVHGIAVEKVHFHEVGAIDAIVDIVGACIGFEILRIEKFAASRINVGRGFVEMDHGKFPVPPPAVAELLRGAPVYSNEIEGELMTPTGAAIISTLCESYGPMAEMRLEGSSYGAGTRSYERFPNVLRLILGETDAQTASEHVEDLVLIETNLDDLSPQVLGFVMEVAFELGALDCWFTPIQMKKNRPATMLSVLCKAKDRSAISRLIYSETTTLGLRFRQVERQCLPREFISVQTRFGAIDVKVARLQGKVTNAVPEYEQVRKLALANGLPFQTVYNEIIAELDRNSLVSTA